MIKLTVILISMLRTLSVHADYRTEESRILALAELTDTPIVRNEKEQIIARHCHRYRRPLCFLPFRRTDAGTYPKRPITTAGRLEIMTFIRRSGILFYA